MGQARSGCESQQVSQASQAHLLPPTVFIYSMPGYKCSIKERMLYSSCKSRLLDSVEQDFHLEIAKKVGPSPGPRLPRPYHPQSPCDALGS